MCFSIPLEVIDIKGNEARVEGGKVVRFDSALSISTGDLVRISGSIVVDKLSKKQGKAIRALIKRLNS